jgi:diguanylate cyclase (GGDEF)-like protein/PAS domain S-box-containing protein
MSVLSRSRVSQAAPAPLLSGPAKRGRPVRILFHSEPADVEICLRELKRADFKVSKDVVLTSQQFVEHLKSNVYDAIVAEYPAPNWQGTQALELLQQTEKSIPLIYVTHIKLPEVMARQIAKGAADCIAMENIGHLPAAVRRVLSDKELRDQRDRAEKKLRHSEARYRALVGNLAYGMCRWNMEGKLVDANPALVIMLGYASRKELMAQDLTGVIFRDPCIRKQILEGHGPDNHAKSAQIDWKRRDGTMLKVKLSGREVQGDRGRIEGYEVIVEDVTSQRELEESLRDKADKDSLTGLANYRRLIDVLDGEIKRSTRTGREFALLLFDLDQLKRINDCYGHLTGNRALCRVADALVVTCREIDTGSRFGGDEFAVVLPETGGEASRFAAQRICRTLAADGEEPQLSVSVGVATYPQDGETIESLLSAGDVSLYAMKNEAHRGALRGQSSEEGQNRNSSLAEGIYAPKQ